MGTHSSTNHEASPPAHDGLLTHKAVRLSQTAPRCPPSEYETDPMLRHMTRTTRAFWGRTVPEAWKHGIRDGGGFRLISDTLVTSLAIPIGAVTCPSAARDFVRLTQRCEKIRYGTHKSQILDVFFPEDDGSDPKSVKHSSHKVRGMVFFVHGGAWGSGKPWFYRLVAKPFLEEGLAVAIVGYRVYPDCGSAKRKDGEMMGGSNTQVDDIAAALEKLARVYPEWCDKHFEDRFRNDDGGAPTQRRIRHHLPHIGTIVIGHSSGSHIGLLWLVQRLLQSRNNNPSGARSSPPATIDAFVGISGVYNIGHHFDYEAGRGVEELSPLKPANGYDRKSFNRHSPPWKVQHELLRTLNERDPCLPSECFPGRLLLVHGAEDAVVPLPGTGEAAHKLKQSLGATSSKNSETGGSSNLTIDEFYVPKTGHEDTVVDLMMVGGHKGPVTTKVVEWILDGNRTPAMRSKL